MYIFFPKQTFYLQNIGGEEVEVSPIYVCVSEQYKKTTYTVADREPLPLFRPNLQCI